MNIASYEMDLDAYLAHSSGARGSGFLSNWHKDGEIVVWIHPRAPIAVRWAHGWWRVDTRTDKETDEVRKMVFGGRFNCLEKEIILKKQKFRNDDDSREYPPLVCPMCVALEHVRRAIVTGELSWTSPLFVFEGEPDEDPTVVLAGGFCGLFGAKEDKIEELLKDQRGRGLSAAEQKKQLRLAHVRKDEAFRQNCLARMQYIFRVIQNSDPEAGCFIAPEAEALGNAVKKVIRDRMAGAETREEGDPRLHPYAFRWTYDENESFSDRYDAIAMLKCKVTEQIQAQFDAEPPSIAEVLAPNNVLTHRATMEMHFKQAADLREEKDFSLPWDEIFGEAEKRFPQGQSEPAEEEPWDEARRAGKRVHDVREAEGDEPAQDDDSKIGCDICQAAMRADEMVCPTCAAEYDANGLVARPCAECEEPGVPVKTGICPSCGARHDKNWAVEEPVAKEATAPGRRMRSEAGSGGGEVSAARKPRRQAEREAGR